MPVNNAIDNFVYLIITQNIIELENIYWRVWMYLESYS